MLLLSRYLPVACLRHLHHATLDLCDRATVCKPQTLRTRASSALAVSEPSYMVRPPAQTHMFMSWLKDAQDGPGRGDKKLYFEWTEAEGRKEPVETYIS